MPPTRPSSAQSPGDLAARRGASAPPPRSQIVRNSANRKKPTGCDHGIRMKVYITSGVASQIAMTASAAAKAPAKRRASR